MIHQENERGWIKAFYDSAVDWWGESWYDGENLQGRLELVQNYGSQTDKCILELGAGTGETAGYLCAHGYSVVAVDLADRNIELLKSLSSRLPALRVVPGDFLQVQIREKFPIVCMFETFGLGNDREQRALLKRVCFEWLQDDGVFIVEVYHPSGPMRAAGTHHHLERLDHVPGSVAMTEYSYYDGLKSRWIDIWEPVQDKSRARVQSIRCYSPADLFLLLEGTGLKTHAILYQGKSIDFEHTEIRPDLLFSDTNGSYTYTVLLKKESC